MAAAPARAACSARCSVRTWAETAATAAAPATASTRLLPAATPGRSWPAMAITSQRADDAGHGGLLNVTALNGLGGSNILSPSIGGPALGLGAIFERDTAGDGGDGGNAGFNGTSFASLFGKNTGGDGGNGGSTGDSVNQIAAGGDAGAGHRWRRHLPVDGRWRRPRLADQRHGAERYRRHEYPQSLDWRTGPRVLVPSSSATRPRWR